MLLKSPKGIQPDDVWTAADQLVAEGLRPTIERVRLKIGRGSPNTVSPLLDTWFAGLGTRLGVTQAQQAADEGLPTPVRQAVAQLWESALSVAKSAAEQDLLQARQGVMAERTAIEQLAADVAHRERGIQERQIAFDALLQAAREQIADLNTRLAQSQSLTKRRDGDIEALQLKLSENDQQRLHDQRRNEEELKRHAQERQQLQEQAASTERRLMLELDRERQATKRLESKLTEAQHSAQAVEKHLQEEQQALAQKLLDAERQLRSERQFLLQANERAAELRGLLDEQRTASTSTIAHLNQLLAKTTPQTPIRPNFKRKIQANNRRKDVGKP